MIKLLFVVFFLNVSSVFADTLCKQNETLFFNCQTKNKKIISLCGDKNNIQYRFGRNDKVELAFPENNGYDKLTYFHYFRSRVDRTEIRFQNNNVNYILFEYLDGEVEHKFQYSSGVNVFLIDQDVSISCIDKPISKLYELQEKLPNDKDWQE